jgi:hypothetical protein
VDDEINLYGGRGGVLHKNKYRFLNTFFEKLEYDDEQYSKY